MTRLMTRRRLTRALVVAAALALVVVPAALGVQSLLAPDPIEQLPDRPPPAGLVGQAAGPPVYVARGDIGPLRWGLTARRCEYEGTTTVATALLLSDGAAGANSCPYVNPNVGPATMPILSPESSYFGQIRRSFVTGVVPAGVSSVELHLERYTPRARPDRHVVEVTTKPLLPGAQRQGRLPGGLRRFVYITRGQFVHTRAIARSTTGRLLLDCTRRECDSLSPRR